MAAAAGMGVGMLGTIGSTIGNVETSDVNAKILDTQARSIDAQTDFNVMQARRKNALLLGEANATGAAGGVAITSGSPLLHELDRVKQTEIEAQNIRAQGQNEAAATRFGSRMTRRQIPFQILGGVAQGGSILSQYAMSK
jgi:hypothetical protein